MPLADVWAALRWWVVLVLLGAAATPLAFVLFQTLADRGYALVKMLGLLLAGYFLWILGSLGFLRNDLGGALLAFVFTAALSWLSYRWYLSRAHTGEAPVALKAWLRENRTQVLLTEFVFAAVFALWVWVRAQNPAIAATEKPMEFAFLNAIGRSPTLPPLDPWLSGFAISYYYFGYVMTSLVARLAFVPEAIAFNLAIAWLVAGTATGALGIVFNLLAAQGLRRGARVLGLVAAVALPLAGNLQVGLEIAHANNVGTPTFWEWLDVRDLEEPPEAGQPPRYQGTGWWWWRASRPIHEYHISGRAEDGLEPIAEFPAFSFILGDLHPHVLALPFAFLALGLAMTWWQSRGRERERQQLAGEWDEAGWTTRLQLLMRLVGLPLWLITALILGGLSFLNTWDVLIYLFVVSGAFFLARWRDEGWHLRLLGQTATIAILILIPAVLLYLPFYAGFRSQAGAPFLLPMLMRPTRLVQFLIIFGMPLWAILIFLVAEASRQRFRHWRTGLLFALALVILLFALTFFFGLLVAASPEGAARTANLASELGITLPDRAGDRLDLGWGLTAVLAVLPALLGARLAYGAMTLFLAAILALVVMIWRARLEPTDSSATREVEGPLPLVLLLVATGALLTLGPEFVYLRDNFGFRLNTIFKFYYQAWVLFGIAALFALGYLWQVWRARRFVPLLATAGYALLLVIGLLFPVLATGSRAAEYRGPASAGLRQPATLDGLAQLRRYNPDEYEAIQWLRNEVEGAPVILEAVGGQYSNFGRISASTGLPTLLGWPGHEYQWRGDTPEPGLREPIVREIYSQTDLQSVAGLLDRYGVAYIYAGSLERDTYGPEGLEKFAAQLQPAFSNGSVTIYRWQPGLGTPSQ